MHLEEINNKQIKRGKTMKTEKLIIAALLMLVPFFGFAQEWDDIYANPSQNNATVKVQKKEKPQTKKIVVVQGTASDMEITANGRDIDEYNRRQDNQFAENDTIYDHDDVYEQYEYTDRIIKFHDPASSVKISGADEVTVYIGDDIYADYYDYGGSGRNSSLYYGFGWNS